MSNDYFTPTAFSRHTKARAENVSAEFNAVEVGFDRLPAAASLASGKVTFGVETGTGNTFVATMPVALTSYVEGQEIVLKLTHSNTGAATLDVDGLGPRSIKRTDGTDPAANDLLSGAILEVRFDGTNFVIMSHVRGDVTAAATSAQTATTQAGIATTKASEADADATATAADRVQTGLDAAQTALDRIATGQDAIATAADRVATGQDATATAADRVQTGSDALSASASKDTATAQAVIATNQAGISTTKAGEADTSATDAANSAASAASAALIFALALG